MKLLKLITLFLLFVLTIGCKKYAATTTTKTTTTTSQQGATPLGTGTGTTGTTTTNSNFNVTDTSTDGVYVQGFLLGNVSLQINAVDRDSSTALNPYNTKLLANGYYTKLYKNFWQFYAPSSVISSGQTSYGFAFFTKKGYFSVIVPKNLGHRILLDNGNVNPPNDKAYIRFINALPYDSTLVNFKCSNSTQTITSDNRKYFDFTNGNIWDNNPTFSTLCNFVAIAPGQSNVSFECSNSTNASFTKTFEAGKKYTILAVIDSTIFGANNKLTFTTKYEIAQHN
jgi:hypothetical protein